MSPSVLDEMLATGDHEAQLYESMLVDTETPFTDAEIDEVRERMRGATKEER